jgi:hypothetical protein
MIRQRKTGTEKQVYIIGISTVLFEIMQPLLFFGRYPLGQMPFDVFHTNRLARTNLPRIAPSTRSINTASISVTGLQGMLTPPRYQVPLPVSPGVCVCPVL